MRCLLKLVASRAIQFKLSSFGVLTLSFAGADTVTAGNRLYVAGSANGTEGKKNNDEVDFKDISIEEAYRILEVGHPPEAGLITYLSWKGG